MPPNKAAPDGGSDAAFETAGLAGAHVSTLTANSECAKAPGQGPRERRKRMTLFRAVRGAARYRKFQLFAERASPSLANARIRGKACRSPARADASLGRPPRDESSMRIRTWRTTGSTMGKGLAQ
jgi:hypothetical protein